MSAEKMLAEADVALLTKQGVYSVGGVAGLRLTVSKNGSRSWVVRANFNDNEFRQGLGNYPEVSLDEARAAALIARNEIVSGNTTNARDPNNLAKKRDEIVRLLNAGKTQEAVCAELNVSRATVQRYASQAGGSIVKSSEAPWARVLRKNSEAAGHLLTARIQELLEPHVRQAIWQAIGEVIEHETEFEAACEGSP